MHDETQVSECAVRDRVHRRDAREEAKESRRTSNRVSGRRTVVSGLASSWVQGYQCRFKMYQAHGLFFGAITIQTLALLVVGGNSVSSTLTRLLKYYGTLNIIICVRRYGAIAQN